MLSPDVEIVSLSTESSTRSEMTKDTKKESFLNDLGRATMRGLRRCRKCGTLNGTRGYSCKNKFCDVVFKETNLKKKPASEPCKISTGSLTLTQVYSVRLRDKGPDYRGFVQLGSSVNDGNSILLSESFNNSNNLGENAKCYADSCQKAIKYSIMIPNVSPDSSTCIHIKSALQCCKSSEALTLKMSTLNCLSIPQSFKDELYILATNTPGPLVQRVSKNIVVVKCKVDAAHPLGFLHFSFIQPKGKKETEPKFYCSCSAFKTTLPKDLYRKCVHFYACVVAFASDPQLSTEFAQYIDLLKGPPAVQNVCVKLVVDKPDESDLNESIMATGQVADQIIRSLEDAEQRSFFVIREPETDGEVNQIGDEPECKVQVEVVQDQSQEIFDDDTFKRKYDDSSSDEPILATHTLQTADGGSISVHHIAEPELISTEVDVDSIQVASNPTPLKPKKTDNKEPMNMFKKIKSSAESVEAASAFVFPQWLASTTELINQTMHYSFSGKPDPLVFHLPKEFFDCLLERLIVSSRIRKQKLTIETEVFSRRDAVPLGKFTKHTIKIGTLAQVEDVLSNTEVLLEPVRYFSLQSDGTYKYISPPRSPYESLTNQGGSAGHMIKPREFKTVLKVGVPSPPIVADSMNFLIEWIPNLFPKTQAGELRFIFEFYHYCNGVLSNPKSTTGSTNILLTKVPIMSSSKSTRPPALAPRPSRKKIPLPSENSVLLPISTGDSSETITVLTF